MLKSMTLGAGVGIERALERQPDVEQVAVPPAALVVLRKVGQVVCRLEGEFL
jgi:hypothetical protein